MAGVPELDWRRFCLAQQMSPRKTTSPRLDLILTPEDLNQTCKNYSHDRAVRITICLQQRQTRTGFWSLAFSPYLLDDFACLAPRDFRGVCFCVSSGPPRLLPLLLGVATGPLSGHPCRQRAPQYFVTRSTQMVLDS